MQFMKRLNSIRTAAILTVVIAGLAAPLVLPAADKTFGPDAKKLAESRQRAVDFLRASQSDSGHWTSGNSAGVTALVVTSLLESGVPASDPVVVKAMAALEKMVQKDGGIYFPSSGHKNYETCVALLAFKAANVGGKYDQILSRADKFLRGLQWDEDKGPDHEPVQPSDIRYGGAGYGGSKRPDLSNTQFLIDALTAAGAKCNDPNIQKALVFVSRCQNLESQHNTSAFASKVNDGGFIYTAGGGGDSPAGKTPNGGLRSYAAMTYAGLKSMIYAGLTMDDPRVKAAFTWIRKHYSVDENPGLGQQGLYYYYHTFAKTLAVLKVDEIDDAKGEKHDWRKELAEHMFSAQQPNGSWVNPKERWLEGDPNLATAYGLLALKYCEPTGGTK
jgi:squalene-hopene/tetraprenyl-beta-curcumene cyclase